MEKKEIAYLAQKFLDDAATTEEAQQLHDAYDGLNAGELELVYTGNEDTEEDVRLRMLQNIVQITGANFSLEPPVQPLPADRVTPVRKIGRWSSAAAILLLGGAMMLYKYTTHPVKPLTADRKYQRDRITPGTAKAQLKLANGEVINLDDQANGAIDNKDGIHINKQDAALHYQEEAAAATQPVYNTLSIPRGGKYQVVLPDGTHVWLNAASSITYPTRFTGNTRSVRLTGEAYFEVATDHALPFEVTVENMKIQVLGTSFNVNAFKDEPTINTTLISGKVQVENNNANRYILQPSQQAQLSPNGQVVLKTVDIAPVIAWKNGYFQFERADIPAIMRQIARWYDVDVVYEGVLPHYEFVGEIDMQNDISKTLRILARTQVHFTIEGRKIIVRP